jgi:hypothetical protein
MVSRRPLTDHRNILTLRVKEDHSETELKHAECGSLLCGIDLALDDAKTIPDNGLSIAPHYLYAVDLGDPPSARPARGGAQRDSDRPLLAEKLDNARLGRRVRTPVLPREFSPRRDSARGKVALIMSRNQPIG